MTRPVDPYSRLYWRLIDDERFVGVYDDDHAFALWGRLLMAADMAWPASAALPLTTRKASLAKLVDAGLVDLVAGGRYRIHGLDGERGKRQQRASDAAGSRWGPPGSRSHTDADTVSSANGDANGMRTGPVSIPPGMPSRAEPSRDEPSLARAREGPPDLTDGIDSLDAYYRLTGGWPSQRVVPWLNELAADHGEAALAAALAVEWTAEPSTKTLLSRTRDRLEREAHEGKQRRATAQRKAAAAEAARIEAMPPEQRQANLARLRELAKANGLDLGGEA